VVLREIEREIVDDFIFSRLNGTMPKVTRCREKVEGKERRRSQFMQFEDELSDCTKYTIFFVFLFIYVYSMSSHFSTPAPSNSMSLPANLMFGRSWNLSIHSLEVKSSCELNWNSIPIPSNAFLIASLLEL